MNDNPYIGPKRDHDTHERDKYTLSRNLGLTSIGLFLLLALSVACNYYQLTQVKIVPYIHNVNDLVEQRIVELKRAADTPSDDPKKKAIVQEYLRTYISNLRERFNAKKQIADRLNIVLYQTIGRARGKFWTANKEEDVFARIKKEGVAVEFNRGQPFNLPNSNVWEVSWTEHIDDDHGIPQRTDIFTARFQLTEIEKEVKPDNIFGLKVIDREIDLISSKPFLVPSSGAYELSKQGK